MTTKLARKIVKIDEEKCNGCGACVPSCAEGALQIINGKARLVSEQYCDGLGACLGECPQGAISIEERTVEEFNEEAAKHHLHSRESDRLPCGCPSATVKEFHDSDAESTPQVKQQSRLTNWPVQLALVPPAAPFLKEADLLLAADCAPFAYAGFHQEFLKDHVLLVACPKLDDFQAHLSKLTEIINHSNPKSITVLHMEVPCCSGLTYMAKQSILLSNRDIPLKEIIISMKGELKS